jgi:hypothetical protein
MSLEILAACSINQSLSKPPVLVPMSTEMCLTRVTTAQTLFKDCFLNRADFTLLLPNTLLEAKGVEHSCDEDWWYRYCCYKMNRGFDHRPRHTSFEFSESLDYDGKRLPARLQVSSAFDRRAWTVTVRWTPGGHGRSAADPTLLLASSAWTPDSSLGLFREKSKDEPHYPEKPPSPFLFSIAEVVDFLHTRILEDALTPDHGLILIAGGTNSSKSKIARGIAWKYLHSTKRDPPHLVTLEDPIEEYLWDEKTLALAETSSNTKTVMAVDYTPRQLHSDCQSLDEALEAALRQTPTVFYIGEIRTEEDLRKAVEFGGTGHLAIATTHAGSLVEAMAKTFKAVGAQEPGTRAMCAPKLLAVIHLKRLPGTLTARLSLNGSTVDHQVKIGPVLPAIYRRTPLGLQTLIADGLAALLPHAPSPANAAAFGSLGRRFFLNAVDPKMPTEGVTPGSDDRAAREMERVWPVVRRCSTREDAKSEGITCDRPLFDLALEDDLYGR